MLTFFRKKMRTILLVVVVVFAGSMFYGIGAGRLRGGESDQGIRSLAKVDGREINAYQYREFLNRIVRQAGGVVSAQDFALIESQAIQQTIDFTILLNEAKKKARISGKELDMAVENVMAKGNIASKKDLERALQSMGMDYGKFRELLKSELLVTKLVRKVQEGVSVLPDDLREVRASHILVSGEGEALDILDRAKKGESFSALAKKYSLDPGSKDKGGDVGFFTTGAMVEPFEKAAFMLKIGDISDVVKTPFGFHVIKLTDSRLRTFAGPEKDIEKAALAEKSAREYQKWYAGLRSKAKVEILHPGLRGHLYRFSGQIAEAIEEYKKAIAMSPNNAYLRVFLGDAYYLEGKKDAAIEQYRDAVRIEGGRPEFYMILATAYEKIGRRDLAIQEYKKISMLAGDNKQMHEELAGIFKRLGALKELSYEKAEIVRIEKKEAFEKSLTGEGK